MGEAYIIFQACLKTDVPSPNKVINKI